MLPPLSKATTTGLYCPPPPPLPLPLHHCHHHYLSQTHCHSLPKKEATSAPPPVYQRQHQHENLYCPDDLDLFMCDVGWGNLVISKLLAWKKLYLFCNLHTTGWVALHFWEVVTIPLASNQHSVTYSTSIEMQAVCCGIFVWVSDGMWYGSRWLLADWILSSVLQDYLNWIIWNCYAVFCLILSTFLCIVPAYLHTYVPTYL